MEYKKILSEREAQHKKVEDLKCARDLSERDYELNEEIEKNKFKYKFYNYLLKELSKNENKYR